MDYICKVKGNLFFLELWQKIQGVRIPEIEKDYAFALIDHPVEKYSKFSVCNNIFHFSEKVVHFIFSDLSFPNWVKKKRRNQQLRIFFL